MTRSPAQKRPSGSPALCAQPDLIVDNAPRERAAHAMADILNRWHSSAIG